MNFLTRISPSFLKTREVSVSDDRLRILNMLAGGKITADEADRLLTALERRGAGEASPAHVSATGAKAPKYLRVQVHKDERGDREAKDVNIRVPLQLLRAGVRLPGLLPPKARASLAAAMAEKGMDFDLDKLKSDNLEAFIATLSDMAIDIDAHDGKARVKVSCE
jgi:hypothetical protein